MFILLKQNIIDIKCQIFFCFKNNFFFQSYHCLRVSSCYITTKMLSCCFDVISNMLLHHSKILSRCFGVISMSCQLTTIKLNKFDNFSAKILAHSENVQTKLKKKFLYLYICMQYYSIKAISPFFLTEISLPTKNDLQWQESNPSQFP